MSKSWGFLQPWVDALAGVLVLHEYDPHPHGESCLYAFLSCWPYGNNNQLKLVKHCTFYVEFPADAASRQDRGRLQRVREAMELFDRLAAVGNASFRALLSTYIEHTIKPPPGRFPEVFEESTPDIVWPMWDCSLSGQLPANDSVAKKANVSWWELFGCPEDPWTYSEEFRDVMTKMQTMGPGDCGQWHNFFVSNKWQTGIEALQVWGEQRMAVRKSRRMANPFSRQLHELFELTVPAVFHLLSVRDSTALINIWRESLGGATTQPAVDSANLFLAKYSAPGVPQVAAALAQTNMTSFRITLEDDRDDEHSELAQENAGFLFAVLACRHSTCRLNGADLHFPDWQHHLTFTNLNVEYSRSYNVRFAAMFSAMTEGSSIEKLTVTHDDGSYPDAIYWRWLAYAFWSRASNASIPSLDIHLNNLTEDHVAAVEAVMKTGYPQPKGSTILYLSGYLYGYVDAPEGTQVRLQSQGTVRNSTALTLARAVRCRAYYDASNTENEAEIVLPGYGICFVTLANGVLEFVSDNTTGHSEGSSIHTATNDQGLRSLSLIISEVEHNGLVERLFAQIGGKLRSLSLDFTGFFGGAVTLNLSDLAAACPALTELSVVDCNLYVSDNCDALRNWGLKKLVISGSDPVNELLTILGDRSYRMARELLELKFFLPHDLTRRAGFTHEYLTALMAHNGELILKENLPLSSRAAFVSVVGSTNVEGTSIQCLDSSVLSLVFSFAATTTQRYIQVLRNSR